MIGGRLKIALVVLVVTATASFGWVAARPAGLGDEAPEQAASAPSAVRVWPEGAPAPLRGFALTDHHGTPVTERDYRGKFLLVFFGYTYCPDVCPTSMHTVSQALDLLGEDAGRAQALFITVDPERDTAEVLTEYLANFHPGIVGLTGTAAQVRAAAKSFGVYYERAESAEAGATQGGAEAGGDYLIDHSARIDLSGPDGRYLASFPHILPADRLAPAIRGYIRDKRSGAAGA